MKNFVNNMVARGNMMVVEAQAKVMKALTSKEKGASHFVEILVAIIIVIAIGFIFKEQISAFITTITARSTTESIKLF
jgi:hypothetical protein